MTDSIIFPDSSYEQLKEKWQIFAVYSCLNLLNLLLVCILCLALREQYPRNLCTIFVYSLHSLHLTNVCSCIQPFFFCRIIKTQCKQNCNHWTLLCIINDNMDAGLRTCSISVCVLFKLLLCSFHFYDLSKERIHFKNVPFSYLI